MIGLDKAGAITVRFWGTRGSLPTPGPGTVRYGGNTCCVELRCGEHLVILDAGSGMREFGLALQNAGEKVRADILLSHTHLDHICGLPFFGPIYSRHTALRIWSGHLTGARGIEAVLRPSWNAPFMPDLGTAMRSTLSFHDTDTGAAWELHPGLHVATCRLNHPGGATGYRVSWRGASVCYLTDTEHFPGGFDPALRDFAEGADLLIYDCCYTDAEYESRVGWGHSTWRHGVALANAADAGRLVLFHHDPAHDDAMMDVIAADAKAARPASLTAQDGMVLTLG
jgi:phosphoribosyl 1,2-cyclic phosphodiesterase